MALAKLAAASRSTTARRSEHTPQLARVASVNEYRVADPWRFEVILSPRSNLPIQVRKAAAQAQRPMTDAKAEKQKTVLSLQVRIARLSGVLLGLVFAGIALLGILLLLTSSSNGDIVSIPRNLSVVLVFALLSGSSFFVSMRLSPFSKNSNV